MNLKRKKDFPIKNVQCSNDVQHVSWTLEGPDGPISLIAVNLAGKTKMASATKAGGHIDIMGGHGEAEHAQKMSQDESQWVVMVGGPNSPVTMFSAKNLDDITVVLGSAVEAISHATGSQVKPSQIRPMNPL
jgi:hypothetical protein